MRKTLTITIAVVLVSGGLWLLNDATTFALRAAAPELGRPRGCYTLFDDWFASKEPSKWRATQSVVGLSLLVAAGASVVLTIRRRNHAV